MPTNTTDNDLESPLILVVDDEKLMRLLLRRSLEDEGYQVAEASNGEEALLFYQQQKPDLVLMDGLMPIMDGFTCCQQLKALYGNLLSPVLIVTSLEDPASIDLAFRSGAADYIPKPIHWAVLRQRVLRLLEADRAMEDLRQLAARELVLGVMAERIRQSLNLEEILKTTVNEVRQFLKAFRVVIFRFNPDGSGVVMVESASDGWQRTPTTPICDACFGKCYIELYRQGCTGAASNTCSPQFTSCQAQPSERFGQQGSLIVPILQDETLWGLLIAEQSNTPRRWQNFEIELVERLATQVAIAIQQAKLYEQVKQANRELHRLASLDGLTGVANRRCFDEFLHREWRRMTRDEKPLSLILFDIDYFKLYNDTYGHLAGDSCLQQIAVAVRDTLKRPADLVARYGGEEFVAILPETEIAAAVYIAEQIQAAVKALAIPHAQSTISVNVTLSIGVATTIPLPDSMPKILIAAADLALYRAKAAGRDRICFDPLTNF